MRDGSPARNRLPDSGRSNIDQVHSSLRVHLMPKIDIQGHRGARGLLPENTIPGFMRALELGVSTLEMDVVITKDEEVVVSHEPWFSAEYCSHPDGTPVQQSDEHALRLFDMTLDEVQSYDCGLRGHPRFPRQQAMPAVKPLLRDVIRAAEVYQAEQGIDRVAYNIETKSTPEGDGRLHPGPETFTRLLYHVLKEEDVVDQSIIQSFDIRTLQVARRIDPDWRTALLIEHRARRVSWQDHVGRLGFLPTVYSPSHELVDPALVDAVHEKDLLIIPWTINEASRMHELVKKGVDGIITDYPDIAVEELGAPRL